MAHCKDMVSVTEFLFYLFVWITQRKEKLMLWDRGMAAFYQVLYFRRLPSGIVNWMEIQEAMNTNVRKRFVGGTFPFLRKSAC